MALMTVLPVIRNAGITLTTAVAERPALWWEIAADLGRHFAWSWWSTLTSREARASADLDGRFTVAAPNDLWRLVGPLGEGITVDWLTPYTERVRIDQSTGEPLPPGVFPTSGRITVSEQVTGVKPRSMTIRAIDAPEADIAPIAAAVAAASNEHVFTVPAVMADPTATVVGFIVEHWRRFGYPQPSEALTALGLDTVDGEDVLDQAGVQAIAGAAAVGFLAAHGHRVGSKDLPAPVAVTDLEWPFLLAACDIIDQTIRQLLALVLETGHLGGWMNWTMPRTQRAVPTITTDLDRG